MFDSIEEMTRKAMGAIPSRNRPVWLEPDDVLANWLLRQVGRNDPASLLVDCGGGVGALKQKLDAICPNRIVSIDIQQPASNAQSEVVVMDAVTFPFAPGMIPVFARPDHSGWVDKTLRNCIDKTGLALYIGLEKNLNIDLDSESDKYTYRKVTELGWTGTRGEEIWAVTPRGMHAFDVVFGEIVKYHSAWGVIDINAGFYIDIDGYILEPREYKINRSTHCLVVAPRGSSPRLVLEQIYCSKRPSRIEMASMDTSKEEIYRAKVLAQAAGLKRQIGIAKDRYGSEHVVEIVSDILEAWTGCISGDTDSNWTPVCPSGMKLPYDSEVHTDLVLSTLIDGKPMRVIDWIRMSGPYAGWAREHIERARMDMYVRLSQRDRKGDEQEIGGLVEPDQRPPAISGHAIWLCGDIYESIRGIAGTPGPGEPLRDGATIAVCPNGSVDYERAARSSRALVVGAGGTTCHLVTVLRPEGLPVIRCDNWDLFCDGDEIEITPVAVRVVKGRQ